LKHTCSFAAEQINTMHTYTHKLPRRTAQRVPARRPVITTGFSQARSWPHTALSGCIQLTASVPLPPAATDFDCPTLLRARFQNLHKPGWPIYHYCSTAPLDSELILLEFCQLLKMLLFVPACLLL